MDRRQKLLLAALVVAGVGAWYVWANQGQAHGLTLREQADAPNSYSPYAWWSHHREGAWVRHYPSEMGPACLHIPLPSQEGAISTTEMELAQAEREGGIYRG